MLFRNLKGECVVRDDFISTTTVREMREQLAEHYQVPEVYLMLGPCWLRNTDTVGSCKINGNTHVWLLFSKPSSVSGNCTKQAPLHALKDV